MKKLVDDIGACKPTFFIGVPRVFDRIYCGVNAKISEAGGIKALLYHWGYNRKAYQLAHGATYKNVRTLPREFSVTYPPGHKVSSTRLEPPHMFQRH